ncbi:unnamed protein product [Urochloa humidicola]
MTAALWGFKRGRSDGGVHAGFSMSASDLRARGFPPPGPFPSSAQSHRPGPGISRAWMRWSVGCCTAPLSQSLTVAFNLRSPETVTVCLSEWKSFWCLTKC